jgi:uncharacterized membrane protein
VAIHAFRVGPVAQACRPLRAGKKIIPNESGLLQRPPVALRVVLDVLVVLRVVGGAPNIVGKVVDYRGRTRSRRDPDPGERNPARVVAFTDAVIAIAVTLLVLDIRAPEDTRHLLQGLAALWPSYLSYAITFMLIGQIWANHHVMFDHIRHVDRLVLFLNTVLLMDIALLPFAARVLANSFRDGQGERTAVVVHGLAFELAAVLFNVIWWHARRDRRLLASSIDAAGVRAIARRFLLALAWIGAGTLLGALLPVLGVIVIAAFVVYYWLPISGEMGGARPHPPPDGAEKPPGQDTGHRAAPDGRDGSDGRDEPHVGRGGPGRPARRYSNVGWPES